MKALLNKWVPLMIGAQVNVLNIFSGRAAGKKAFEIFCTTRKGKLRPKDLDFLNTCQSKKLLTDGGDAIQTYSWNDAGKETVLLMHGWESNAARWKPIIPLLLNEGYRVVAMDGPAHGGSGGKMINVPFYATAINRVVDAYQPDHLVGHSMGGMSVVYFLHNHGPKSVKSVALLGAPAQLPPIIANYKKILGLSDATIRSMDRYLQSQLGYPIAQFRAEFFRGAKMMPMLVVHDQGDKVCRVEDALYVHRHFPESELFLTEGLGHGLKDQRVYDRVIDFFREGPGVNEALYQAYVGAPVAV